ncbi:MAG: UTP--glucose-1-phosphate uridylyltransferase [Actinomycetia bacterium]|nr:UTP--glucose-1-phosphate uridylyltransferase [Actinomycetes bacterium]
MGGPPVTRALIPAAGRGTRFLPVTKAVPKELLPIVSTPALQLVVAEAASHGMADVLLVRAEGRTQLADYFAVDEELEAALADRPDLLGRVREVETLARIHQTVQAEPRGLGDAVARGEGFAAGGPLAVLLPDDLIDDRDDLLGPMLSARAERGGIVLALLEVPRSEIGKYGVARLAPGADPSGDAVAIVDLVEKPAPEQAPSTFALIGRYLLPPEIFAALRETDPGAGGEVQLTDAIRRLTLAGVPTHGVVFRGRRYDTGDRLDYLRAVVQLAVRHPDIGAEFTSWLREYVRRTLA